MELSEGKLFTIEALNRIEGFEWPDGAAFAAFDGVDVNVSFYRSMPWHDHDEFTGGYIEQSMIKTDRSHPDWKNSLITRAEFESVDGWVRVTDYGEVIKAARAWEFNGMGDKWRFVKPLKQVKQPTAQPSNGIETLISQHKAAKQSTLEARRLLEHAEAIEHNLLLSIEAWAESHGFDIRALDEVKK